MVKWISQSTSERLGVGLSRTQTKNYCFAPLAQLYRALVFGTKGWGLESLVEHQNLNLKLYRKDLN